MSADEGVEKPHGFCKPLTSMSYPRTNPRLMIVKGIGKDSCLSQGKVAEEKFNIKVLESTFRELISLVPSKINVSL